MPSLIDLPNEVLHRICSVLVTPQQTQAHEYAHISLKNVGSLRLACRRFDEVGAYYVLQEIKFYLTASDLAMLASIARHPTSSQYVRSLVYVADILPVHGSFKMSRFQKMVFYGTRRYGAHKFRESDNHISKGCEALIAYLEGPSSGDELEPREEPFDANDREDLPMTVDEVEDRHTEPVPCSGTPTDYEFRAYSLYKKLLAWQTEVLKLGLDCKFLEKVIPGFSNVRHITVASGESIFDFGREWLSERRSGRFEGGPLKKAPCPAWIRYIYAEFNNSEDTHMPHGEAMLSALRRSSITLETLRISRVNYSLLRQLGADEPDEALLRVCGGLREFELVLLTGTALEPAATANIQECNEIFATGNVRKMLRAMPNLEKLHLTVDRMMQTDSAGHFAPFTQILERGFVWTRLHRITLRGIHCHRDEMLEFISNHKSQLVQNRGSHVYLDDLKLCKSSWLVFLPLLRQIVKEIRIEVRLRGVAIGEDEESGREETWRISDTLYDDPLAGDYGNFWRICKAMDEYVQGKSRECPLTRDNMNDLQYMNDLQSSEESEASDQSDD